MTYNTIKDDRDLNSGVNTSSSDMLTTKNTPSLYKAEFAVEKLVSDGESSTSSRMSSWDSTEPLIISTQAAPTFDLACDTDRENEWKH
jgi:hypothetical protein